MLLINSDYYEKYWSKEGFCPRGNTTPELATLLQKWIKPGCKCLDVGCGDGRTSGLWLRNHGCNYVGADISASAIELARNEGLEAVAIGADGRLPFESESFDAAVCIEVMEHMFAPQDALSEIRRVLRPHGTLLVTVPNCAYWRRRAEIALLGRWNPIGDELSVEQPWRDPHIRFFNPSSLKRLLRSIPFDVIEVGGHAGSLIRDIPGVGKWLHRRAPRLGVYRILERSMPALFGYALHGIAQRP
ncbi:MAG: class I SAM-dependent methyltransferase [Thermoguttaceae bacterium]